MSVDVRQTGETMRPTADQIAYAVVTAARALGEDPELMVKGELSRARHYAYQALLTRFPDLGRTLAAQYVGSPKPQAYWQKSWHQIVKPNAFGRPAAHWWDHEVFERVTLSIPGPTPFNYEPQPVYRCTDHHVRREPTKPAVVADHTAGSSPPKRFRLTDGPLQPRRKAELGANITATVLGDPEPDRSALAQRQEKSDDADE